MKKIIIIFFLSLSCDISSISKEPNNYISESTLINIIYDYTILNSINDSGFSDDNLDSIFNMDYIYKKYDIDSVKLIESQKFYSKNPRKMMSIYLEVDKKLKKAKDSIDFLIKSN